MYIRLLASKHKMLDLGSKSAIVDYGLSTMEDYPLL